MFGFVLDCVSAKFGYVGRRYIQVICRGVASIGLSGFEPPLCLLTEWAGPY